MLDRGRGVGVHAHEQRLVVEHLLEVRDEPALVDGVAGEAAADVVVDAARRHRVERRRHSGEQQRTTSLRRRRRRWSASASSRSSAIVDGNFGAAPNPPQSGSNVPTMASTAAGTSASSGAAGARGEAASTGQRLAQRLDVAVELVPAVTPCGGDRGDQLQERRLRVVRPAVERLALGREEHGHRPPAATGHRLHRVHVDGVDVGSLLAVDLDVDERRVHRRGHRRDPRTTRGPSRGTSGTPSSRPTAGPARRARAAAAKASAPTGTNRPGCRGAGAGTATSPSPAGSRVSSLGPPSTAPAAPVEWNPPSTWTISPVVAGNQSHSRATHALATGSGSLMSQPSGARSSQMSSNRANPGMLLAAIVRTGPAATRLQRMPLRPELAGEVAVEALQRRLGDAHPVVGRERHRVVEVEADERAAARSSAARRRRRAPSASRSRCAAPRRRRPRWRP